MAAILIIGCGKTGSALGRRLQAEGHTIHGLKRQPPISSDPIVYHAADITNSTSLRSVVKDFDLLIFIVSPDKRTEQCYQLVFNHGLANVLTLFKNIPLLFVSSTSVYGQNNGEWVDEESTVCPREFNGRILMEAEQRVWAANSDNTVIRFSGIYGPGREYLLKLAKGHSEIQRYPSYYTNRIHSDDCIDVLAFLATKRLAGVKLNTCFLASDNDPAPLWEVISWLSKQLNYPPPTAKPIEIPTSMNKRCRNNQLRNLGYRFLYPSFRDGYRDLIQHQISD